MPDHYFSSNPTSSHQQRFLQESLGDEAFVFETDAGTFSKKRLDFGTRLMIETAVEILPKEFQGRVWDMGCGWGPVGVMIGRFFPKADIWMSDVNQRALDLAKQNLSLNHIQNSVCLLTSDGDESIPVDCRFDFILLNPPIRAGKSVIYRLFEESCRRLSPQGTLLLVIQKKQGADSAKKELERLFSPENVETVNRKAGYHILKAQKEICFKEQRL